MTDRRAMPTSTHPVWKISAKLAAAVVVLACVAVGAVGLILPIVPGLLFLAVGAFIAAKHFPSMDRWLRRRPTIDRHLNRANRLQGLGIRQKAQLIGLVSVKAVLDGIEWVVTRTVGRR